jgi:voltage-gated potassium channel
MVDLGLVELCCISLGLVMLTVSIHTLGTGIWVKVLQNRQAWFTSPRLLSNLAILLSTAVFMLSLNALEAVTWAGIYLLAPGVPEISTFETATYFSFITFTTLGYGDVTLRSEWQLLCGLEAMNGIFLFGWSAALLYAVVQRLWDGQAISAQTALRLPNKGKGNAENL